MKPFLKIGLLMTILATANAWSASGYTVINGITDDVVDSLDTPYANKFFKNVENQKNFVNNQLSLGYVRADKINPKSTNKNYFEMDKMYKFFIVHKKDNIVDVAPYTLVLEKTANMKNVTYKTFNNNVGMVCIAPKYGYWFNEVGELTNENNKNQCIVYDNQASKEYRKHKIKASGWNWYQDNSPPPYDKPYI